MEKFTYLGLLLLMIAGLLLVDLRLRLAFFYDWRRATKTICIAVALFVGWDLLGTGLGIFYPGNSRYDLGILVLPKVPIEELFFLFSFVYLTLLLWRAGERYADVRST